MKRPENNKDYCNMEFAESAKAFETVTVNVNILLR